MDASKTHVAVVDDDESFARALGRMLRASGFEILLYPSAEAFIREATNLHLDCVVLDVQLGGMSGLDLRRRMLVAGWSTPVIFVTAHDEIEIRQEAEEVGCVAYLRKPVRSESLLEAIRKAVPNAAHGR